MQTTSNSLSAASSGSTTLEVPHAADSSPSASAPTTPLVASPPAPHSVFGTSTTSIFNNPDALLTSSPVAVAGSSGTRLRTLGPRRSHFPATTSKTSGKSNDAAVKEVDDPTTTPANLNSLFDKSQNTPNTLNRLFSAQPSQSVFNKGVRSNSYQRGSSDQHPDLHGKPKC